MSLLFLPVACKDRLDAMKKPIEYNIRNQKKRSMVIYCICAVVGMVLSIPHLFRFTVISKDEEYFVVRNVEYMESTTALLLGVLVALIRTASGITAGVLSVSIARHYRRVYQNREAMVQAGEVNNKTGTKMLHERNLALLLLAQVLLSLIGYLPLNVRLIMFFLPANPLTSKSMVAEAFAQAAFSWNVLIYIGMSQSFRKEFFCVVRSFFCFICHKTGNNVVHVL